MEITRFNYNNFAKKNNYYSGFLMRNSVFKRRVLGLESARISTDIYVKGPVATTSATGLLSSKDKFKKIVNSIRDYGHKYVKNVKHTYDHKVIYGLVEKELYKCNTINSLTHDADKMCLYLLGFPKSFVSKFHRIHSSHHPESGKKMDLKSMLCDNIASSPYFKPEKKQSLRDYYNSSKEMQSVSKFKNILEQFNYGENLNFEKIKKTHLQKYKGLKGFINLLINIPLTLIKK